MERLFSKEMRADAMLLVGAAAVTNAIVDVSAFAEQVRLRHAHENIAREDIEALVVQCGEALSAPMEISTFDDLASSELSVSAPEPANELPLGVSRMLLVAVG